MSANKKKFGLKNLSLQKTFQSKNILVTGGTGSIGSEIVRQLFRYKPKQIRIFSRDESKQFFLQQELNFKKSPVDVRFLIGDIRDKERLDKAMFDIDIAFHAAALKHVPFCEYNPFEAIKTNVHGTQNLIDLTMKHNVKKVIAVSTDKAVYPNTIMGVTKLLMERMIISTLSYLGNAKTKFSVVRFGNVLNSRGSVIPLWIEQIKNGGPVTVTDKNMKRYFMSISEAVNLVFLSAAIMKGQEIFVLKMKEENIYDLAQKTIKTYAPDKKIKIVITGIREREKISEVLFTNEEKDFLIDLPQFYVILPSKSIYKQRHIFYISLQ